MKHRIKHNQLGRNRKQATALYRSVIGSLFVSGKVQTTMAKAKAVVGLVDRVINFGKQNDINAKRQVVKIMGGQNLLDKIFNDIAPRMTKRNSGYTRIVKVGPRFSDNTDMVFLELLQEEQNLPEVTNKENVKEVVNTEPKKETKVEKAGLKKVKSTAAKKSAASKKA